MLQTAGRWPWKLEPAKECVITHLPNEPALKMDDAEANDRYRTSMVMACCVGGRGGSVEGFSVNWAGAAASADLGVSSN